MASFLILSLHFGTQRKAKRERKVRRGRKRRRRRREMRQLRLNLKPPLLIHGMRILTWMWNHCRFLIFLVHSFNCTNAPYIFVLIFFTWNVFVIFRKTEIVTTLNLFLLTCLIILANCNQWDCTSFACPECPCLKWGLQGRQIVKCPNTSCLETCMAFNYDLLFPFWRM